MRVMARTGVASTRMTLVAYSAQTKRGKRNQVRPGARIVWVVTMKLRPVRIEEKPTMKTPTTVAITWELLNMLL
ncbi:hypothetical protein D3C87_1741450 [compost metagenome]